ncbi:MAG: acyltransferase [Agathobacter sp.]|nr:acyltransferase [Agathobacter sp.]
MKKRIDFLDYLKAVAIMLVITTHYDWIDKKQYVFTMFINMAVPIFLIVSGYNYAMSYDKKTDGTLKQMYNLKIIWAKLERIIIPALVASTVELILFKVKGLDFDWINLYLNGGYGPGSYYVPLMVQLILMFPLIYIIMKVNPWFGLISIGIVNLLYEYWVVWSEIEKSSYRLSIGRYLLLIAFGCYMYMYPQKKLKWWILAPAFIYGLYCQKYYLHEWPEMELFPYWRPTAIFIAFYICPIIVILFRIFYHSHIKGFVGDLLVLISKASYHIFLFQMIYYRFKLAGSIMDSEWYIAIPINMLITITVGILLYKGENWIRSQIKVWRK